MVFTIIDSGKDSNFQFNITNPRLQGSKTIFKVIQFPASSVSVGSKGFETTGDSVLNHITGWIGLIRNYNSVKLNSEEEILDEYEKEFYENFEFIDEDGDTPFELEKQILLDNYISEVIIILQKDAGNSELVAEAEALKEKIPKLTRKSTVKLISKLFLFNRK